LVVHKVGKPPGARVGINDIIIRGEVIRFARRDFVADACEESSKE
jgi:hypothetical protein